ncbi:MAG: hypothetical protein ACWGQW_01705 [bacterium]
MERLKKVAEQVRKAYEEIAATENRNKNLCGYCCRASSQLLLAAQRHGIDGVEIVVGSGHVYNLYKGQIVDVTATQFDVPDRVHMTPFNQPSGPWTVSSGPHKTLQEMQLKSGWNPFPSNDIPTVLKYDTVKQDPFEDHPYDRED